MKCSLALFVHAFIPNIFEGYVSHELGIDNGDQKEDGDGVVDYVDLGDQLSKDVEHFKHLKGKDGA